jgi:hypothetical protein
VGVDLRGGRRHIGLDDGRRSGAGDIDDGAANDVVAGR